MKMEMKQRVFRRWTFGARAGSCCASVRRWEPASY